MTYEVKEPLAKYLAKVGYKRTDLGEIPGDWDVTALGDISIISSGGTPSRTRADYWNGDIPWITTSEVDFSRIEFAEQFISNEGLQNSAAKFLPPGTILLALYGQGKTRGKVGILGIEAATNQACASIEIKRDVSPDFLLHFLTSRYDAIRAMSNGGSQDNLNSGIVKSILVPVPLSAEQRAIATALSDVDALIAGLEKLIAKKRDLKQAAMQQLLTGQTRLPGFSGEWNQGFFGDVVTALEAGVSVNSIDTEPTIDTPCVLKTSALVGGRFLPNEAKVIEARDIGRARTSVKGDTILISRMNTPTLVGEVAYVAQDFDSVYLPDRVWMVRFNASKNVNVQWMAFVLCSQPYRDLLREVATGTSGSMKNISKGALLSLPIQFPSSKEQFAIATVLSNMDAGLAILEIRLAKTRDLKQGMMQELLTGRTRLV